MYALLKKPILFTFEKLEYLQDKKEDRKKLLIKIDKKLGEISSRDPALYKKIVFLTAAVLLNNTSIAKGSNAQIDAAGLKLYETVQTIGYWVILIMFSIEILKNCRNGKDVLIGVLIKYLIFASTLFGSKWAIDTIREMFQ